MRLMLPRLPSFFGALAVDSLDATVLAISAYGTSKSRLPNCQGVQGPESAGSSHFDANTYSANDLRKMPLGSRLPTERWDVEEERRHF
jgi:hypothetical protein